VRIILEKAEVLTILGKHFDTTLSPENVVIRTEPSLEIELLGISMNAEPARETLPPPPPPSPAQTAAATALPATVEDVLALSEELKRSDKNTLSVVPPTFEDEVS